MWMRIFSVLLSYFLGRNSGAETPGMMGLVSMKTIRKAALLVTFALAGLMLMLAGTFTVLLDLVLTSRDNGALLLSAVSVVGFALLGFAMITFAVVFLPVMWKPVTIERAEEKPSPLNEALADLVRDFTEERRAVRQDSTPARFDDGIAPQPPTYM